MKRKTMSEHILTSEKVTKIFLDPLFKDDEDKTNYVLADGVLTSVAFHPGRLASHKEEIITLLNELPEPFHEKTGGGWTFLNAAQDKNGVLWTGEHRVMEQLFLLGIGIARVKLVFPRELWSVLPGGMPYYVIFEKDIEKDLTNAPENALT